MHKTEKQDIPLHYVCTREEARKLIDVHNVFFISYCGCREDKGRCQRSRLDVCLDFDQVEQPYGSEIKEVSREFVEEVLKEAEQKYLVPRPFRYQDDRSKTSGICFCCDDCCGYFINPDSVCDKGQHIEKTNTESCIHCGACVEVCYFGVRKMVAEKLVIDREGCYGCGLCLDVCPVDCIQMVERK